MAELNGIVRGKSNKIADQQIDANKLYNITDIQGIGLTNAQMIAAISPEQEGLFAKDSVYICVDEGTYKKDTFYKFTVNYAEGTASWEEIPMGGGEKKYQHNITIRNDYSFGVRVHFQINNNSNEQITSWTTIYQYLDANDFTSYSNKPLIATGIVFSTSGVIQGIYKMSEKFLGITLAPSSSNSFTTLNIDNQDVKVLKDFYPTTSFFTFDMTKYGTSIIDTVVEL